MSEFLTLGSRGTDMTGWVFGRLTVLGPTKRIVFPRSTQILWLCRCQCGTEKEIRGSDLRRGAQMSCGCYMREHQSKIKRTHGQAAIGRVTPDYKSWQDMRARCHRKNHRDYHNYGGRGISIDPRWDTFEQFLADMGPKPTPSHTLERNDVNKGYGPDNCRWATKQEQSKNTRRNRQLTYKGRTMIAADWAREVGLMPQILVGRLRDGWSLEAALFTPVQTARGKKARRLSPTSLGV